MNDGITHAIGPGETTMTLEELGVIIGEEVRAQDRTTSGDFTASFPGVETKDQPIDACFTGTYGYGKTPNEAKMHYARELRGKWLVANTWGNKQRMEFRVPCTLVFQESMVRPRLEGFDAYQLGVPVEANPYDEERERGG
jgi:hypothetical protein